MSILNPRPLLDDTDLAAYVAATAVDDCCPWCGRLMRSGHIQVAYRVPPTRGGQWRASNLTAVCDACAQGKPKAVA